MLKLSTFTTRQYLLALFVCCVLLLGFGLYLQHAVGLTPCPMCIMQRYAFVVVAVIALVGGIHAPKITGQRIYLGLIALTALFGGGVALRQTMLQLNPPEIPECGPDLEFMLDTFPLAQALPMIFSGSGDCAAVDWSLFGLSIANWSLVMFAAILVLVGYLLVRRAPQ